MGRLRWATMRTAPRAAPASPSRLAALLVALAAACALAGCGKGGGAQNPSAVARSTGLVYRETVPGAVSVTSLIANELTRPGCVKKLTKTCSLEVKSWSEQTASTKILSAAS